MNRICIFLLFITISVKGLSQESTYRLSLDEAVQFAIDSSYNTVNSRRDIASAIKQKWETTATGLPQISASVSYQNNIKQPVTLIPAEFTGGEEGTFVPITFGTKQNAMLSATLSQLLFDGSYIVGLQAAKVFLEYSENASEKTTLEVRKGVILAYGSVLLAEENVAIFEKNQTALEKNLLETNAMYANGFAEEEDVEQLQITLTDIRSLLSNAKRLEAISRETLNMALGIPISSQVTLTDKLDQLADKNIGLSMLDKSLELEKNIDFRIAENFIQRRTLELKLAKSMALPSISAFVNYGTQSYDSEFSFLKKDQPWYQSSVFGINMNIPLFSSGGRSAGTQRAKIELDKANTLFTQTREKIELEFNRAKSDYRFSVETYDNSKRNLALAERIENKQQVKFTEGISSSFELRQAQLQLYSAQQNYLKSMLNVISTKAILETILNTPNLKN